MKYLIIYPARIFVAIFVYVCVLIVCIGRFLWEFKFYLWNKEEDTSPLIIFSREFWEMFLKWDFEGKPYKVRNLNDVN